MPNPGRIRMTEEPEQVLEQDRITAAAGRKECRAKIAIGQQHRDGAGENRQSEQQQKGRHQDRPHEQRHFVQRHAWCTHVEDGGDEVDRAENRRRAREVQRQDGEVDRRPGMAAGRQRCVERPATSNPVGARLALEEQ
jgi:hypothetical protein